MRLAGRIIKSGKYWAIEIPILEVFTQGRTKKEAFEMIADAVESLANKERFKIDVYPGKNSYFEIGSSQTGILTAFILRRQRIKSGLTLLEVSRRLDAKSLNSYARYEQGQSIPTMEKFSRLLSAVSPERDFVLIESQCGRNTNLRTQ